MRRFARCIGALALALVGAEAFAVQQFGGTVSLPGDRIVVPEGRAMKGVVVLISDAGGWDATAQAALDAAVAEGAVAVGVDLPAYRAALAREMPRECLFLPSDIEKLSRHLHRQHKAAFYRPPVVIGLGEGASLALAIAAQTPNGAFAETIGATVAVAPSGAVDLPGPLCTSAPRRDTPAGAVYGLAPGNLPNPVRIVLADDTVAGGRELATDLSEAHPAIVVEHVAATAKDSLRAEAVAAVDRLAPEPSQLDLPLVEAMVGPTSDIVAIFYSGDGGWRDIDQQVTHHLNAAGVPVVGVDALRYFWSEKSPEQTAADLSRVIATYRARLGATRIVLIGYSFGANILPKVHALLPDADRRAVELMTLLAPSRQADFEIAVSGWLGVSGAGKQGDPVDHLAAVEPGLVQCVYGVEEEDSACPALAPRGLVGVELVARPGGHHFDEDYAVVAEAILARLRLGKRAH